MRERTEALQMFEENQKLVGYVLRNYKIPAAATYISYEDLLQVGYTGLWDACQKYDASRGTAFSAIAIPYIKGHLWRLFRSINAKRRDSGIIASLDYKIEGADGSEKELGDLIVGSCIDDSSLDVDYFVNNLSEQDRELITYRLRGFKQPEIAEKIGRSQAHVSRALKRIGNQYITEHAG